MTIIVWGSALCPPYEAVPCVHHMRQRPMSTIWGSALCPPYETAPYVHHMRQYRVHHMRQHPVSTIWGSTLCPPYETVPCVHHMRQCLVSTIWGSTRCVAYEATPIVQHMRLNLVFSIWDSPPYPVLHVQCPAYEAALRVQLMRHRPVSGRRCSVVSTNSACCQSMSSSLDLSLLWLFTKFPPYFTPFLLFLSTLVTSTIRPCHQPSQHFLLNSAPACLNIYIFVKWIHDMSSSTNCCH